MHLRTRQVECAGDLGDARDRHAVLREQAGQLRQAGVDGVALSVPSVVDATGAPASNIMIAVSHNHSGPGWTQNPEWARKVVKDLGDETAKAANAMRPVSIGSSSG